MQTYRPTRGWIIPLALAATSLAAVLDLSMSVVVVAQQPAPDAIAGTWEADDGSVKLDMYKSGEELRAHFLYGKQVVEADNVTLKKDIKNPDPGLRSRSLQNIVFIWGLRWTDGEWSGGSLYDASTGRTYHCKVAIKEGKMLLRGYLGVSVLGQTTAFHRLAG